MQTIGIAENNERRQWMMAKACGSVEVDRNSAVQDIVGELLKHSASKVVLNQLTRGVKSIASLSVDKV